MKKITLLAATAALLGGSVAQAAFVKDPVYYSENFFKIASENDHLTDGWTSRGVDAVPADETLKIYYGTLIDDSDPEKPVYGAPYYSDVMFTANGYSAPFISTCFENGKADQWIISPEIEIPYDISQFSFDLINYSTQNWVTGASASGYTAPIKVMVSDTDTEPGSFVEIGNAKASCKFATNDTQFYANGYTFALNGYKGKKVHLALVVETPNIGMLGWTNLKLGQYAVSYADSTPVIAKDGEQVSVRLNIGLKTPMTCKGFNAILETNGTKQEKYYKKTVSGQNGKLTFQLTNFNDPGIVMKDNKSSDYTVTIIPVMEDAEGNPIEGVIPTVISGSVKSIQKTFPSNVVMEEATASGCGWCPRGMGSAEYYKDLMAERRAELGVTDNKRGPKFIPIMVHSNMNYADPMNSGVEGYVMSFSSVNGSGLPMASFNRAQVKQDPSSKTAFDLEMNNESIYRANINHVESANPEITFGDDLTVSFAVESGFTAETTNLSAAVLLLENDVKGYSSGYNQHNYLARYPYSQIGASQIPEKYFERFLAGGELGMENIRYDKMTYQEVARGIWPSYEGETLTPGFTIGVPREFKLTFKVPENIINIDNQDNLIQDKFDVVVIVINNEDSSIVASDIMDLATARKNMGVEGIADSADSINIIRQNASILVNAPEAVNATLYTTDGAMIGSYSSENGTLVINPDVKGVVIVRATTASKTATAKVIL